MYYILYLYLKRIYPLFFLTNKLRKKKALQVGLEPTTPGLEVQCAIHCATVAIYIYKLSLYSKRMTITKKYYNHTTQTLNPQTLKSTTGGTRTRDLCVISAAF